MSHWTNEWIPRAVPAAVTFGASGEVDESGVLDIEVAGYLGKLLLDLGFTRARHESIVHVFDLVDKLQLISINDR